LQGVAPIALDTPSESLEKIPLNKFINKNDGILPPNFNFTNIAKVCKGTF